ncbi:MAG: GAF domain-containing sensor histidine kinase [Chloroflexota bacterium]
MPAFEPTFVRFVLLLVLAVLYLPIIFYAIRQRDGQEGAVALIVLYSLIASSLGVIEAFWRDGTLGPSTPEFFQDIEIYGTLALSFLTLMVAQVFLRRPRLWIWFTIGSFWALGLVVLATNPFNLPEVVWTNGALILPRSRLGPGWAVLGWLIFTVSAIMTASIGARQARQSLFRNRLNYWAPAFAFLLANDIMLFAAVPISGNPLRLGIAFLMAYVVCTHNLPDLRQIWRRVLNYAITIVLIVGLYVAAFWGVEWVFRESSFNPLLAGAIISLVLAMLFQPLHLGIRKLVGIWMKADNYDTSRTLHEYSQNISNILDMDRLAHVVVAITMDAMRLQRGFLFLVDTELEADGSKKYILRSARSPEERQMVAVELDGNGPIAQTFGHDQRPLLQYDLDLLPTYRSVSPVEREWFSQLQTEVYVPIYAKKQWIGLLAFGSKLSGNRYTEEDLVTMGAVANQTAVALENARLVDNLMRLNAELRQARRALEKNNRDLERLDQTKSDFISIASHELRTPLTVIKGYSEMMLEDENIDPNYRQIMKSIHDGTMRLYEVMDSMFDIAQIDARTLIPHMQTVEIGQLTREVCNSLGKALKERHQTITVEFPVLPRVKSDPNLLRKLFHHLISNAIKFTPNNGKIRITACALPPSAEFTDGGLEIIVIDTGVGVDPNFRDVIFTKFYQPGELGKHSTSKTRFKGSGAGLGLALSKGIVEAHGGRIWVESPGYDDIHFPGSQFHVILPLTRGTDSESSKMCMPVKFTLEPAAA